MPARTKPGTVTVLTAMLALMAMGVASPQAPAPQPASEASAEPRITVDVNLVVLYATVTDQKGHPVSGLSEQDFRVFEDGVPQQIKLFSHEDVPVTAGLVVDHSGSMGPKLTEVGVAAQTFAQASNPNDRMFVVNFNEHVQMGLPPTTLFSSDPVQLQEAISKAPAAGMTALYDAICKALERLQEGGSGKKVLLVISDGGDNASTHTLAQTLTAAEQSSAVIYCIGIFDPDDADRNPGVLRKIAGATGGLAFFPSKLDQISAVCARIAREIRSQYLIGYSPATPAKPGEYRTIRVTAQAPHHGKLIVRTRTGYRVGDSAEGRP